MFVIEVYDRTSGATQFYKGLAQNVLFDVPDDTLTEANGWHKVRMSREAFDAFVKGVSDGMNFSKKFWLS